MVSQHLPQGPPGSPGSQVPGSVLSPRVGARSLQRQRSVPGLPGPRVSARPQGECSLSPRVTSATASTPRGALGLGLVWLGFGFGLGLAGFS